MPLIFVALAGLGFGSFLGSQADDAIETATGERATAGIPVLQLLLLLGIGLAIWRASQALKKA